MTQADIQACAGIVHKGDPDRFAAIMAAPVAMRDVLFPMHALAIEVARAPWATQEPMIAEMRLQWWRDALAEIAEGKPARQHEVVSPLSSVLKPETAALLDGFVEVRRWDIYKDPFEDEAQFDDYLRQSSGAFYRALCQALGDSDESAMDFGYATGLANYFRAIPLLEARGRIPLVDGRPEAIQNLAQNGLKALKRVQSNRPSKTIKSAYLAGWQTERILSLASVAPDKVAEGGLVFSDASSKMRLMIKATIGRV